MSTYLPNTEEREKINNAPVTLEKISPRQREIIAMILQGKRQKEIAAALEISPNTLKAHLARIRWLFKARNSKLEASRFSLEPLKVLIIDDDKLLLKALAFSFTQAGYRADTASDGNESIPFLANNHYDVIICDLFMPNISGFALIGRLKEVFGNELPVVVISALNNKETLQMMGLGNLDFVEKPFHVSQLLEKIKKFEKISFR